MGSPLYDDAKKDFDPDDIKMAMWLVGFSGVILGAAIIGMIWWATAT